MKKLLAIACFGLSLFVNAQIKVKQLPISYSDSLSEFVLIDDTIKGQGTKIISLQNFLKAYGTYTANNVLSISNSTGLPSFQPLSALGGGSVTSVGLSAPSIFSVSGSPVTGSGTLSFALANQSANQFFAGYTNGSNAPTFRPIYGIDLPATVL